MGHFKAMGRAECCDECGETPCAPCGPVVCEASLECESRSASGSKEGPPGCAFFNEDDGKYYLKRTRTWDFTGSVSDDSGTGLVTTQTSYGTYIEVEICDEETGYSSCSSSGSVGGTRTDVYTEPNGNEEENFTCNSTVTCPASTDCGGIVGVLDCSSSTTCSPEHPEWGDGGLAYFVQGNAQLVSTVYEDEWVPETTEELIARVQEDFGEFGGEGCTSARNLSDDESAYSESQARWRIRHPRPSSGHITVELEITTTPEGGSPSTSGASYTWAGSPDGAEILSDWTDIAVPASDGTRYIAIVSIDCAAP